MKKSEMDSKLIIGMLITALASIGGIGIFLAMRKDKNALFDNLGQTLSHLGEVLENHKLEEPAIAKKLGKKLHQRETSLLEVAEWVATGIDLWKKFKK
jgi:hypothetical protein